MNTKWIIPWCIIAVCATNSTLGCSEVVDSDLGPGTHLVQLYSGGSMIRQWHSADVPTKKSWEGNDWYFTDAASDRLVRISGTIVITTLSDAR